MSPKDQFIKNTGSVMVAGVIGYFTLPFVLPFIVIFAVSMLAQILFTFVVSLVLAISQSISSSIPTVQVPENERLVNPFKD